MIIFISTTVSPGGRCSETDYFNNTLLSWMAYIENDSPKSSYCMIVYFWGIDEGQHHKYEHYLRPRLGNYPSVGHEITQSGNITPSIPIQCILQQIHTKFQMDSTPTGVRGGELPDGGTHKGQSPYRVWTLSKFYFLYIPCLRGKFSVWPTLPPITFDLHRKQHKSCMHWGQPSYQILMLNVVRL